MARIGARRRSVLKVRNHSKKQTPSAPVEWKYSSFSEKAGRSDANPAPVTASAGLSLAGATGRLTTLATGRRGQFTILRERPLVCRDGTSALTGDLALPFDIHGSETSLRGGITRCHLRLLRLTLHTPLNHHPTRLFLGCIDGRVRGNPCFVQTLAGLTPAARADLRARFHRPSTAERNPDDEPIYGKAFTCSQVCCGFGKQGRPSAEQDADAGHAGARGQSDADDA